VPHLVVGLPDGNGDTIVDAQHDMAEE